MLTNDNFKIESSNSENLISVIIPCRNEIDFIEECLNSLLNQSINPEEYEIIVVDGKSNDGTREILSDYEQNHAVVKIIVNEKIITPVAFNLGIRSSKSKYIAICGSHATYAEDYLARGIELLEQYPDVACSGGPIVSDGKTTFAKAASLAMASIIGVGNANHRFPNYEGYAEMACFPFFKREVFDLVGYYDETLVRNQDDEFCFRLRQAGHKIFISPIVKSKYYVRNSPSRLFRQYFNYGYWRWIVLKKHKIPISYRHFAPSIFIIAIILLFLLSIYLGNLFIGMTVPVFYLLVIVSASLPIVRRNGLYIGFNYIFSVIILHFSYGIGFLYGIVNQIIPLKN